MNTLSRTSPTNTSLRDADGVIAYTISTPLRLGPSRTTIKRGDSVVIIASVNWGWFNRRSTITINGQTMSVGEWFPRSNMLATVCTTVSGEKIKWRGTQQLNCISPDTGVQLVTYERARYHPFKRWESTLNVSSSARGMIDELIVTWVIAEKKARERRRGGQ